MTFTSSTMSRRAKRSSESASSTLPGVELAPTGPLPWEPDAKDKLAVKFLLEHAAAGLLLDPGNHKTSITLAAFTVMHRAGKVRKALVVAPRRVCHNVWPAEVQKWADFSHLKVAVLHGPKRTQLLYDNLDADIYCVTAQGLAWFFEMVRRKVLPLPLMLVIDELSKFKRQKTVRFSVLREYLGRFRYRWGLTGSPAANHLLDLFGQAYVLDLGRALGGHITQYRVEYFDPTGYGGTQWKVKGGAEKQIYHRLRNLMIRIEPRKLPPRVLDTIEVTLPPKVRRIYDDMETEFFAELDKATNLDAVNKAVAFNKCRQIASGGVYYGHDLVVDEHDNVRRLPRKTKQLHDEKTEAVVELIDELQGSPLLIYYDFGHDLERLRAALPELVDFGGTDRQVGELLAKWNRGEIAYAAAHPDNIGYGLNMQASGHHVLWYTLPWNFELYDQAVRRIWRDGQRNQVTIHHVKARGTIDDVVEGVLRAKDSTQQAFFSALLAYRKTFNKTRI